MICPLIFKKEFNLIKNYEAFILSYNNYKNSSIIASFLTKKNIISSICYQAKKNSKAFGSDLESISKLNINIYEKKSDSLSILKESNIIKNYNILEKSIYSSLAVFYIRELLLYFAKDFDERYFILMDKTLYSLEENEKENQDNLKYYINILLRAFEIKLLYIAGLSPLLDNCVLCERENANYYSINEGGLICSNCKINIKDAMELDYNDIVFMKIIKHSSMHDIVKNNDIIKFYNNSISTIRDILQKSIYNHIHRELKSLKVLEEILFTDNNL